MVMVKDQYYHIEAHWGETTGAAVAILAWSYTAQSLIVIPATSWFYPEYVSTSPYTVTVTCPSGYTGTNATNPNVCSEICGDSIRVGNEVCDHGNTVGGDGCAAD